MAALLSSRLSAIPETLKNASKTRFRCFVTTRPSLKEMNDPFEHATGIEKREMEQWRAGNKDPWLLNTVLKRGPGTKEQPTLIPSAFDGRIVGCICKGNRFVNWMWLEKGEPKRCECGFYYQIQKVKPI